MRIHKKEWLKWIKHIENTKRKNSYPKKNFKWREMPKYVIDRHINKRMLVPLGSIIVVTSYTSIYPAMAVWLELFLQHKFIWRTDDYSCYQRKRTEERVFVRSYSWTLIQRSDKGQTQGSTLGTKRINKTGSLNELIVTWGGWIC